MDLTEAFRDLVLSIVGTRLDPMALYRGRVVLQHPDGSLSIKPNNPKARPVPTNVPIQWPCPGFLAKVEVGTEVLYTYRDGNWETPIVVSFSAGGLKELTITATQKLVVDAPHIDLGGGATRAVARHGDGVALKLGSMYVVGPSGPLPVLAVPAAGIEGLSAPQLPAVGVVFGVSKKVKAA